MKSEYNKQADDFLTACGVTITITRANPQIDPRWAEDGNHGTCYSIELLKSKKTDLTVGHNIITSTVKRIPWDYPPPAITPGPMAFSPFINKGEKQKGE